MPVTVRVPTPLRKHTGGAKVVEAAPGSVGEVLESAMTRHPALRSALFRGDGSLRDDLRLFVESADIRSLEGLASTVAEGQTLSLIPPVAGA